uniref:Uncharacterized protein n=1 Tax=Anguilla anguilla TaxID=7936 RepID=A0A0E9XRS5_ANGAN
MVQGVNGKPFIYSRVYILLMQRNVPVHIHMLGYKYRFKYPLERISCLYNKNKVIPCMI